jgi:hypothetical protein
MKIEKSGFVRKTIYITPESVAEIDELSLRDRRSFAITCDILIAQALKERKRKRKDAKDNNS